METVWNWWNFGAGYLTPKNKFQICDRLNWKQPRFIAFSIEDAQMICDILNASQPDRFISEEDTGEFEVLNFPEKEEQPCL